MLHAGGAGRDRFEGGPMRWFLVLSCAFVLSSESAAQAPSRWTLSAGPEWTPSPSNSRFYGGRARAGDDPLPPPRPVWLGVGGGNFFLPAPGFYKVYFYWSSGFGFRQKIDITIRLS